MYNVPVQKAAVRARASVEWNEETQTNETSRRTVRIVRGICKARKEEGPLGTQANAPPYFVVVGVELNAVLEPRGS